MNMKLVRTIKIRLQEHPEIFQPTIDAYTKAFNHTCTIGWKDNDYNGVSLHHKVYRDTRVYLPSQLAVSARMKATEALSAQSPSNPLSQFGLVPFGMKRCLEAFLSALDITFPSQ